MYNKVANIMRKKTSTFFRLSLTLFIISFSFLIVLSILLYSQNQQMQNDFLNNKNIHLIEINSYSSQNGSNSVYALGFSDVNKIEKISKKERAETDFVFSEYGINFGITDDQNRIFYLRSYDEVSFLESINDGVALSSPELKTEEIELQVPNISVTGGGFTSHTTEPVNLMLKPVTTNSFPVSSLQTFSDSLYVNANQFQSIIEKIYGISWADFTEKYDLENDFGINLLPKIYVYVADLADIKPVAQLLSSEGYNVNYTLRAFDDLAASIDTSFLVFLILAVLMFLVTTVMVIVAFKNYLLTSKKDIGILKFYGYSSEAVMYIYKRISNYIFVLILLSGCAVTFVFSQLFISENKWMVLLVFLLIEIIFIVAIRLIVNLMLRKICYSDTLVLIRNNDELNG